MTQTMIVVPCYNEELRLPVERFRQFVASRPDVRFLMVNDGSTDGTLARLEWLKAIDPDHFLILNLQRNVGKAEAVRQGCCAAFELQPEYVGYWDADLAAPLEAVPRYLDILDRRPDIDLVIGTRLPLLGHAVERSTLRWLLGRVFAWSAAAVLGLRIQDTQCGHKVFRSSPRLRQVFQTRFHARWIFDVELFARWIGRRNQDCLRHARDTIFELPLEAWRDVAGSKLKPLDFPRAFLELANIARVYLTAPRIPAPHAVEPLRAIPFTAMEEPVAREQHRAA